ncbi:MAG: IclR family transcriptional regulator domain-containing protein [Acidimicrobiales bacterium]
MARRSSDPDFIEALARGLDVIRAFQPGDRELSLTMIASRSELARPTARRVLLTLEELGYVRATSTGYSLTVRVLDLGLTYVQSHSLWELVHPHLGALSRDTAESCSLAQLDGSDIVYVARVAVPKIVGLSVEIGTRFPAYATSLGKVLLAWLDRDARNEILDLPSHGVVRAFWQPSREEIHEDLDCVASLGYALTDQQLAPGVRSVAVPLRAADGSILASINVNASATETSLEYLQDTHLPRLLRARDEIEEDLARLGALPELHTSISERS